MSLHWCITPSQSLIQFCCEVFIYLFRKQIKFSRNQEHVFSLDQSKVCIACGLYLKAFLLSLNGTLHLLEPNHLSRVHFLVAGAYIASFLI